MGVEAKKIKRACNQLAVNLVVSVESGNSTSMSNDCTVTYQCKGDVEFQVWKPKSVINYCVM